MSDYLGNRCLCLECCPLHASLPILSGTVALRPRCPMRRRSERKRQVDFKSALSRLSQLLKGPVLPAGAATP